MPVSQPPLQDAESFSQLFSRTQLIIYRFIYGLHGGPHEDVEDLTCDTYMRAWNARHRFSGDDHDALCWLMTIARNLVIDEHRRAKSHFEYSSVMLDERGADELFTISDGSPEEQSITRDQYAHLWASLQRLPPDRREMLVLRYMLGWEVKQIALLMVMQENTVSVYLRRSLEVIRKGWASV